MIEIHIKQFLDGHNQEKLEEKLRETLKEFELKEFHIFNTSTGNEVKEIKPIKPDEIRISYKAIKDYLKEYGDVKITKESFEAFKSLIYCDIH